MEKTFHAARLARRAVSLSGAVFCWPRCGRCRAAKSLVVRAEALDEFSSPLHQLEHCLQQLIAQRGGSDGDNALRGTLEFGKPSGSQWKAGKAIEIENEWALVEPRGFRAPEDPNPERQRNSGWPSLGRTIGPKDDRPRHGQAITNVKQSRAPGLLAGLEQRLDECAFLDHARIAISFCRESTSVRGPVSCAERSARRFRLCCARACQERDWRSPAPRRR